MNVIVIVLVSQVKLLVLGLRLEFDKKNECDMRWEFSLIFMFFK